MDLTYQNLDSKKNNKREPQATSQQFSPKRLSSTAELEVSHAKPDAPCHVPSLFGYPTTCEDNVMSISPRIQIEVDHMRKVVHWQAAKSLSICLWRGNQLAMEGNQGWLVLFQLWNMAIECHRNRWLTHWTWWFSSSQTVNVYQRLCVSTHWKVDNQNCHLLYPGPHLRRQLVPILCFLSTSMSYLSVKISREDLEETMVIAPEFFGCPWILPSSNSGIFYNYHIGCGCTLVLCYHRLVSTGMIQTGFDR